MEQLWKKISPFIHILTIAFAAGTAWAGISAYKDIEQHAYKIKDLEYSQREMQNVVIDLRISNARIEEGLKDIKRALNIKNED